MCGCLSVAKAATFCVCIHDRAFLAALSASSQTTMKLAGILFFVSLRRRKWDNVEYINVGVSDELTIDVSDNLRVLLEHDETG